MPSSSGTTFGSSPCASVRRTTSANVAPGSAVHVARFDVDVEHRVQRRDVDGPAREPRVAGQRHEVMHAALVDMDRLLQRGGGADLLTHRLDLGVVRTRQ